MWFRMVWIGLKHIKARRMVVREAAAWVIGWATNAIRRRWTKKVPDSYTLFRRTRFLLLYCANFQDLYNLNVDRIKSCTSHIGYYDPVEDRVRIIPFCAMNAIHGKTVEKRLIEFAERQSRGEIASST